MIPTQTPTVPEQFKKLEEQLGTLMRVTTTRYPIDQTPKEVIWTLNKTKAEVEERYIGIGARRAHQGVPFSQFLYAIHATKENLWDFMQQEGLLEPGDLISQMELLRAMEHFFDRALYFASIGHESVMQNEFIRSQATIHTA